LRKERIIWHGSQKPKNTFTLFKRCTSYLASAGLSKGWFLSPEGHFEAFLAPSGHHEDDLPIEKCKGILGRLEPKMNRADYLLPIRFILNPL